MNYKEKYEQALERAKKLHSESIIANLPGDREKIEQIFPELRESEDERIRKAILKMITDIEGGYPFEKYGIIKKDTIAWLEKQCEQKPIEQDKETHDLWVYIREWNDKFGRLPKDEDELASCIDYVMKRQKPSDKVEQSCYHNDGLYYAIDILEKTFGKVEGYQSDDGIIEHQTAIETVNALYHKKPAEWSEDDEKMLTSALWHISNSASNGKSTDYRCEVTDWLKSLKPHWKPSEEQMESLKIARDYYMTGKIKLIGKDLDKIYQQLKKL